MNLKTFCVETDAPRLFALFSVETFSYATDRHIIIRVPRQADIAEDKRWSAVNPALPFEGNAIATALFREPPAIRLPPADRECSACCGSGREHDCPDCRCDCPACGGSGEERISAALEGLPFDLRYLRVVFSPPAVAIAVHRGNPPHHSRLFFRFEGGDGALMPLARPWKQHIELDCGRRP